MTALRAIVHPGEYNILGRERDIVLAWLVWTVLLSFPRFLGMTGMSDVVVLLAILVHHGTSCCSGVQYRLLTSLPYHKEKLDSH